MGGKREWKKDDRTNNERDQEEIWKRKEGKEIKKF
jgi:hypothetical protein